jgi:hypothetical protein
VKKQMDDLKRAPVSGGCEGLHHGEASSPTMSPSFLPPNITRPPNVTYPTPLGKIPLSKSVEIRL